MTSSRAAATIPAQLADHLDMLLCPACGAVFEIDHTGTALRCAGCSRTFSVERGVAQLFWPTDFSSKVDVTEAVKAFYEETPFPNYDDLDSPEQLRAKAEEGLFARLLNDQIPHGSKVIECGCGTGQLSNFLGLTWGRTVFGTDLCMNSLRLGHRFKDQHDITGVSFVQMNLFRPAFRPGSFDVVISNGVLHHTSDPYGGFRSILRLLKQVDSSSSASIIPTVGSSPTFDAWSFASAATGSSPSIHAFAPASSTMPEDGHGSWINTNTLTSRSTLLARCFVGSRSPVWNSSTAFLRPPRPTGSRPRNDCSNRSPKARHSIDS
jgi:SAM-dependent methyltransferase